MAYIFLFGPYQPFIKHYLVRNATGHSFSLNSAIQKVDKVQTEACRPCGTHIFSEMVASFGVANLKVAKKGAQKYKKYDIKMRLCTVSRFPPICINV